MKALRALGIAAAGWATLASAAFAADLNVPGLPTVAPASAPEPAFNWNRFYLGAFAGAWVEVPPTGSNYFRAGIIGGRNFVVTERFVVSIEGTLGFYDVSDPYLELYANARAGVLATDRIFVYALAGIGFESDLPIDPDYAMMLGGGVEFAVSNNLTFRADALFWRELGDVFDYLSLTAGVTWYLGR